jgi:glycogen debranching enzyme
MTPSLPFAVLLAAGVIDSAVNAQVIFESPQFRVEADRVKEGEFESRAISRTEIESNYMAGGVEKGITRRWRLVNDLSRYPRLTTPSVLVDALYNLSLDELQKDLRADGAFMAGRKWGGVWTRDISYSILLSLAAIEPEVAKTSLLQKVARGRIIQDTGTGGSWPVSTDRMIWAVAAWEIYNVTGDRDWLAKAFEIIRKSAEDDREVIFSRETGLALGESSFLDWREQTYPRWMQPVDIYSAQALGTNAVHYRTYRILAEMARLLKQPAGAYDQIADTIRDGMNLWFWLEDRGYYGQYVYGRIHPCVSPRSEALGEALVILFDIAPADRQLRMLRSVPVMPYGIPTIYPQIPGIPPYHNNSVWPFVQAYWNLATARHKDLSALLPGMAALYRASALFLTNQENLVADSGAAQGTEINSERQLWSVAGSLAMTWKVLFGMEFTREGLQFHPVIPKALAGPMLLEDFRYRAATLRIHIDGYGTRVKSVSMDGAPLANALVPGALQGRHEIAIVMANDDPPAAPVNLVSPLTTLNTPIVQVEQDEIHWAPIPGAVGYRVFVNGPLATIVTATNFHIPDSTDYREYQVEAVDEHGFSSFRSKPLVFFSPDRDVVAKPAGSSKPVEISKTDNATLLFHANLTQAGEYAVDVSYANGSGPINTENKCALRSLLIDGTAHGAIVFPQRGREDWTDFGYSSRQLVKLAPGIHEFRLRFDPSDENMNGETNRALIDHLRLIRIR